MLALPADSTPLVSIVTPSFNQAAFLEDAIRSVLAQDYPAIEYLVVDGGSTDGSVEIIRRYAPRLAWWISEADRGQAEAIGKGLERARGEIVAWLNSDDLYLPGAVGQAVAALQAHPQAGLVYGNALTIDGQGRPINRLVFPEWGLEELASFRVICQPAVFARRAALEGVGGLDRTYHYLMDHQAWLRIATIAPLIHRPAFWAAARFHPAAKNVARAAEFGGEVFRILEWMGSQPELAPLVARKRRKVLAGARRLNARYLLEGGLYSPALRAYGGALLAGPLYTLRHAHRILYAALCALGAGRLAAWFRARQQARQQGALESSPLLESLRGWPGLQVDFAGRARRG